MNKGPGRRGGRWWVDGWGFKMDEKRIEPCVPSSMSVGEGKAGNPDVKRESGREENHEPKQDPLSTHVNHSAKPAAPP